jgi:hypothetical protein
MEWVILFLENTLGNSSGPSGVRRLVVARSTALTLRFQAHEDQCCYRRDLAMTTNRNSSARGEDVSGTRLPQVDYWP